MTVGRGDWLRAEEATKDEGPLVSIELKDTDVREALRKLGEQAGVGFVLAPQVRGRLTARLHNLPLQRVLRLLLDQVNATFEVQEGIYLVYPKPPERPKPQEDSTPSAPAAASEGDSLATEVPPPPASSPEPETPLPKPPQRYIAAKIPVNHQQASVVAQLLGGIGVPGLGGMPPQGIILRDGFGNFLGFSGLYANPGRRRSYLDTFNLGRGGLSLAQQYLSGLWGGGAGLGFNFNPRRRGRNQIILTPDGIQGFLGPFGFNLWQGNYYLPQQGLEVP
ncbi:MAG TPA: hypothetical protein EYP85_09555 [Armatimonadetes bacterium]|nr:hypothetical protein [Armatimonadota bacterium]